MMIEKPLCIIPARGGSKRIPKKNIKLLQGKPLLAYSIEAAKQAGIFETICVSSEDDEILAVAKEHHVDDALKRPDSFSQDTVTVTDVVHHVVRSYVDAGKRFERFCVLLPTSPFRTPELIREAYHTFCTSDGNYLMSLLPFDYPPQNAVWAPDGYVQPRYCQGSMKQSTELEPLYKHDGNLFMGKVDVFLKEKSFYFGSKILPYYLTPLQSVDIDHPIDFLWAEFLLTHPEQIRQMK